MDYRFKANQMRDNSANLGEENKETLSQFEPSQYVRNLRFVWPDGQQKFLNYAYLVSGEFLPDQSSIHLIFTSEVIVIEGIRLVQLFDDLLEHKPKQIICINDRYTALQDESHPVVTKISVLKE
jgi:hypothetical protein